MNRLNEIHYFIFNSKIGSRLCQASLGTLPCFSNMRTSSPTIIDAYQTAFLQCVVHTLNRNEF
jgi:hypothetical protein